MSELEKYAYIRCPKCGRDNRLIIDSRKTGLYQCGGCQSHLMFYGTEKQHKYKNWIWATLIGLPVAFMGYKSLVDNNSWTDKNIQKFEKACEARIFQTSNLSLLETEQYCECVINKLIQIDYDKVVKSTQYYMNRSQGECRSGRQQYRGYR
ncbi:MULTISPECIES: hypothetical protein [Acinetobacter]|jgi:DNA-directed RNA polymerase subunit RPC12/RpoP|uniref:Uncharacterized protein n=2 Tax=Acinetobacter TaxID=469 RepID=A0AAP9GSA3_9GAMM|nr:MULTISPECIES: hypothetical protein [Acinetobacter]AVH49782.1 hypothetical protein C3Y93_09260 [Acinetobacter sp. SWBY1]ENV69574.1 hypothetical protein F947_01634 [Acinetobacter towneri DSM 14962 = CIP 107472]MCA4798776.1 hypothetical protein [Acinetobacter towneri]MCO8048420.1 hypothetical protein [Acinetobacter towneri]MCO8053946.1 hypothetical protein [Acinetobacter towneri]